LYHIPKVSSARVRRSSIIVAEFIPVLLILLIPFSVNAGVFDALAKLFAADVVATSTVAYVDIDNSARFTPLLNARVNPDPLSIGGGDITAEDGALMATGPVGADEIAASPNKNGEISVYVVREGDALSQIANMYGVTTNTILWANDLTRASEIQPGDTLVILPIAGVQHTVAKGETLGSIVKKYSADMTEVLEYNNLTSDHLLTVGDEIMIPGGDLHAPAAKKVTSAAPTKSTGAKGGSSWLSHPAPGAVRSQGIHGYNGVDLAGASGSAIRAAAAGEVI
jgi:LysM repeat protein